MTNGLIMGIGLIIIGITILFTGLHSVDLIQNYYRIAYMLNTEHHDNVFDVKEFQECARVRCDGFDHVYMNGIVLIHSSIIPLLLGGWYIGHYWPSTKKMVKT